MPSARLSARIRREGSQRSGSGRGLCSPNRGLRDPAIRHTAMVASTASRRSVARTVAISSTIAAAANGVLTNYATDSVPGFISTHPAWVWVTLIAIVAASGWFALRGVEESDATENSTRRRLDLRGRSRLVQCLGCGYRGLVSISTPDESGFWRCPRCDRKSIVRMDAAGSVTTETSGHGQVEITERNQFFGFLRKVYKVEYSENVDNQGTRGTAIARELTEPGSTEI
jgi:hypothetical protein